MSSDISLIENAIAQLRSSRTSKSTIVDNYKSSIWKLVENGQISEISNLCHQIHFYESEISIYDIALISLQDVKDNISVFRSGKASEYLMSKYCSLISLNNILKIKEIYELFGKIKPVGTIPSAPPIKDIPEKEIPSFVKRMLIQNKAPQNIITAADRLFVNTPIMPDMPCPKIQFPVLSNAQVSTDFNLQYPDFN